MVKKVELMNVDHMSICQGYEACGFNHKLYLDWKKNVDKYQGAD